MTRRKLDVGPLGPGIVNAHRDISALLNRALQELNGLINTLARCWKVLFGYRQDT